MSSSVAAERVRGLLIRNSVSGQDLLLLVAALAVTLYALYDIDVFVTGNDPVRRSIELDELPIVGVVLSIGMLLFSWRRSVEQKRERRRRIVAERQARELAMQDPLTGMANRRQFTEALAAALAAPPRAGGSHALLLLDVNGFKRVNDVYGHEAGDAALVVVAQRIAGAICDGDLAARVGGDEFAVLAQHLVGPEAATSLALRILDSLTVPIGPGANPQPLSAGIGIALFPIAKGGPEEVLRRADVALAKAKTGQGSSLRFFDDEMDRMVLERGRMERELRAAMRAGEIRPQFQPLLELKTGAVVGFEALARWTHAELGEIAPDRFIPIAEETGLIHELSDQLLRSACRTAVTWPAHVVLAFNISPSQLHDRTLPSRILRILAETGLGPRRLEVEITESALVRDLEAARHVLGSLREAGVRIALDDFGTGYSSLYHLRNFKVDKIKIDRSFIEAMETEHDSAEIVGALIGLGRGLGLTVTAEGISGEAQNATLSARGCEQGQGFLFSHAVSAEQAQLFFNGQA